MKTILNKIMAITLTSLMVSGVFATEFSSVANRQKQNLLKSFTYKVKGSSVNKLVIESLEAEITVEAYDGKELLVEVSNFREAPQRAKGLRPIYYGGVDNTGVGLQIKENESDILISGGLPQFRNAKYSFKIPNNLMLIVNSESFHAGNIKVKKVSKEINIKAKISKLILEDITGPLVLNNMSGDIEIVYSKLNQESPTSITTLSGAVDVSLPADTKANIVLQTMSGGFYTDLDLEMKEEKKENEKLKYFFGGQKIVTKMNGGGVVISINNMNGNVYLRKK